MQLHHKMNNEGYENQGKNWKNIHPCVEGVAFLMLYSNCIWKLSVDPIVVSSCASVFLAISGLHSPSHWRCCSCSWCLVSEVSGVWSAWWCLESVVQVSRVSCWCPGLSSPSPHTRYHHNHSYHIIIFTSPHHGDYYHRLSWCWW